MYESLFTPIRINTLEVRNRIAYPSLGLLYSYDGTLNQRYHDFYVERARGGAGIVTIGPVGIDFIGSGGVPISLDNDDAIPHFKRLADDIRSHGASPWVQLYHAGAYAFSFLLKGEKPVAPSAVYSKFKKETPRELGIDEIKQLQEAFVRAAERAKEAGIDGVEIIGSAGYLITQFLSPVTNKRTDEYGGSLENRLRFPVEIIQSMRARLGASYPLGIRMAGNDFVPGSNTDRETPLFAQAYERAGIDVINVTGGWHETRVPQITREMPRGGFAYLALNIKRAVSVPVMASNRIPDPDTAERIIRDGVADMVNLGRVLIADPEWPNKVREGRAAEVRPCVACGQGCMDELFSARPVMCIANPMAGFEGERAIIPTNHPKKIMVIGAGPGGLEAAVTAAQRGHAVTLYEKSGDIGGQLHIAGAPPHKQELWEIIRYYRAMLRALPIALHLNTEATAETVAAERPDHVIVAEGAEPFVPKIDGIDGPGVVSAWTVLRDDPMIGRRVAVIGGGAVGIETAQFIAAKGTISPEVLEFLFLRDAEPVERIRELATRGSKEVTIFEMLPKIGKDIGRSTRWVVMADVERDGITVIKNAKVLSVKDGKVTYEHNGATESVQFDTVVTAIGSKPVKAVSSLIGNTGVPFTVIGDGVQPGKINDAIHGGFLAATGLA